MKKQCVICDKEYEAMVNRGDNVTCSVACRSKLHRERRKAKAERKARLVSDDHKLMMRWLSKNVPNAAHNLSKLKAIHGKEAFELASEAMQALGQYQSTK